MFRVRPLISWIVLAHAALITTLAWLRFSACHNQTFDLALYARGAWGLAHGDVWNPIADGNLLHTHAAWVLWPLGLLGRWFGTAPVLLFAQAAAIAACLWPLSRIAQRHLGERGPLYAAVMWIGYPNLGHVGTYEMHPGSLALLPMCWALDAIDRKQVHALALATLGVLACRADYALITCAMGLWVGLDRGHDARQRRHGALIAASSLLYLGLVFGLQRAWPAHGPSSATLHFGDWGGSPLGIIAALLRDPTRVWQHVAHWERVSYLARVLLPLALLPLWAPRWLWLCVPTFAINLISHWPTSTRLDSHYLSPALPALIVSALFGLTKVRALAPRMAAASWLAPAIASLWIGGLPWSWDMDWRAFVDDEQTTACRTIVARIPRQASFQGPDPLLPHLAERTVVHRGPPPERSTDYVALDIRHRQRFAQREDLLRTREEPLIRAWLARDDHGVVDVTMPWLLLARSAAPRQGWAQRYFSSSHDAAPHAGAVQRLTGCLAIEGAVLRQSTVALKLLALGPCPPDLALRIGTSARPTRVDLPFDGVLSPVHLRAGDRLISAHALEGTQLATIDKTGLWLGTLRESGAVPKPQDPVALRIPVDTAP